MNSVSVALQKGVDHLSKHSSFAGVLGFRGVKVFELLAHSALALPDYPQESTSSQVRAGGDCQQAQRTENKSDNAPRGFFVALASCCCCCDKGASGSSDNPKSQQETYFASITTHLLYP